MATPAQLTNKLVLTKGSPLADVAYGIDNTFAVARGRRGRARAVHPEGTCPRPRSSTPLDGDEADQLTPVDYGDVCVNVDDTWFAEHDAGAAATLDDLTDAGVQGPVRHARRDDLLAGARLPARHDRAYGDGWQATGRS